jgi:hypothetical protein
MDTSAISGSSNGDGLQGQIQVSLLKKSQDIQASQVLSLLDSAAQVGNQAARSASLPHQGNGIDVTA